MKARQWTLLGLFVALCLAYVVFFTEWLRPAPIQIASQIRFSLQPPRFGRPVTTKTAIRPKPGQATGDVVVVQQNTISNRPPVAQPQVDRVGLPAKGGIDQAPGGVANVTFSLDGWYSLTHLRVEDVPADGSTPQVLWELKGKSLPLDSLLYDREPQGMSNVVMDAKAAPLVAGAPYRLILEAGRRRGTNNFTTVVLHPPE